MPEEELVFVSDGEKIVRVLGLKFNAAPADVKILVNDVDILKNVVVQTIKVVARKGV